MVLFLSKKINIWSRNWTFKFAASFLSEIRSDRFWFWVFHFLVFFLFENSFCPKMKKRREERKGCTKRNWKRERERPSLHRRTTLLFYTVAVLQCQLQLQCTVLQRKGWTKRERERERRASHRRTTLQFCTVAVLQCQLNDTVLQCSKY